MRINELYYGIQGEGFLSGHPTIFVRLSKCNLNCKFCDSKYANKVNYELSPNELFNEIIKIIYREGIDIYDLEWITITGGEPLLQLKNLKEFENIIMQAGLKLSIETNGTIEFDDIGSQITISPKLTNSGNININPINIKALSAIYTNRKNVRFKFVLSSTLDLEEIKYIKKQVGIKSNHIYLMPEGTTEKELKCHDTFVWTLARKYGYLYSDRLHVRLFGNERGV